MSLAAPGALPYRLPNLKWFQNGRRALERRLIPCHLTHNIFIWIAILWWKVLIQKMNRTCKAEQDHTWVPSFPHGPIQFQDLLSANQLDQLYKFIRKIMCPKKLNSNIFGPDTLQTPSRHHPDTIHTLYSNLPDTLRTTFRQVPNTLQDTFQTPSGHYPDFWWFRWVVPSDNHTTLWPNFQPGIARTPVELQVGPSVVITVMDCIAAACGNWK